MDRKARTDLAVELKNYFAELDLKGITVENTLYDNGNIKQCIIDISDEESSNILGKPIGKYITIESKKLNMPDENINRPIIEVLCNSIYSLIKGATKILVVGLGNRAVTPDSLGPCVVDNLYITRHLLDEGLVKNIIEISAIAPGVMAQTGIETQILLKSICDEINPEVVIAIDALAAMEPSRLNTTIQICDTGINPGGGVGNSRARICSETIGCKVIAIGVPTVISVCSLIEDCIDKFLSDNNLYDSNTNDMNYILDDSLYKMYVTPQNVDEAVKRVSYSISEAINHLLII